MFNLFKPFDILTIKSSGTVAYNPLINYDWSTTTTSGLRYLKDVGSTPTYNASMYFGRGAYLNGVDQSITVPINATIQTALKRVNGVVTINETSQTLTDYVISGLGVHKDYYLFTRLLTTAEKDSYTNTPELFYAMAQADSNCVLNMPMCETSSTVRNYKTGIDYPITNYTTSVRGNAKKLQYGLQTCKFVRDSLGVIQSASDYLGCDGVGYANTGWKPSADEDWTLEVNYNISGYNWAYFGTDLGSLRMGEASSNKARVVLNNVGTDVTVTVGDIISVVLVASGDVYINKVFQKSVNMAGFAPTYTFTLGFLGSYAVYDDSYPFMGVISKFKLHNKLLTNEEIQAL